MPVPDDYDRSGAMAAYAAMYLSHFTLAEATAFVVERRLAQFKGDADAAAKSLGIPAERVRRLAGVGSLFEKVDAA